MPTKTPVCPWWGGYFLDNPLRRLLHRPERILAAHVRPGMKTLDFGCGMGFFAVPMARLVGPAGRVIAVDLQQKMLDVLARRAARAGVARRVRTVRCDPHWVGLGEVVDFALAFYCVHEVPDPQQLLDQLRRCVRPGGPLLVAEPMGHVRAAAFQQTVRLAKQAGFRLAGRPRIALSHAAVFRSA